MLSRNILLRDFLRFAICYRRCDENLKQHGILKDLILDDGLWERAIVARNLLALLANAINEVESDSCRISVIPTVWSYVETIIKSVLRKGDVLDDEEKDMVIDALNDRCEFTVRKVHLAGNLLDPRFVGKHVSEEGIAEAENFITKIASDSSGR